MACESTTCSICCTELTIKNIVNPECGHSTCKDCFWRWAKDKNTCPFCRTYLLKNDTEAQDIQQMRSLLEHRTRIVRQVEASYEELDKINREKTIRTQNYKTLINKTKKAEVRLEKLHNSLSIYDLKVKAIKRSFGGLYSTYRYFRNGVKKIQREDREERERIDEAAMNLAHGDKGMCIKVLNDIKILGRSIWLSASSVTYKQILDKVREMNKIRKERSEFLRIQSQESVNIGLLDRNLGLNELFAEHSEELPSFPEPIGLYEELELNLRDILNSNREMNFTQIMIDAINRVGNEDLIDIFNDDQEMIINIINEMNTV